MQDFGTKANDTAGPSGQLSADEFNNLATELENAVLRSGLALSGASVVQMATSLFIHSTKSQTFQDSGAANAYVATPVSGSGGVLLPADYTDLDGAIITFKASNSNSGASTVNIGQTTGTLLGTKVVLTQAGAAVAAGAITSGAYVQLRFDASLDSGNGAWVLLPWSSPITDLLGESVLSSPGYVTLPIKVAGVRRNFIVQWKTTASVASGGSSVESLPIAFPNACLQAFTTVSSAGALSSAQVGGTGALATTSVTVFAFSTTASPTTFRLIAIGW